MYSQMIAKCTMCNNDYYMTRSQARAAADGYLEAWDYVCPICDKMLEEYETEQYEEAHDRWIESGMIGEPEDYTEKGLFDISNDDDAILEKVFTAYINA